MTNSLLVKPNRYWFCKCIPYVRLFLYTLIFLLSFTALLAQKPYTPEIVDPLTEPWRWENFPELLGKGLRCMSESADGSMWFGVDKGVIKYDGLNWTKYNIRGANKDLAVNQICISRGQKIYAGTDEGIFIFVKNKWNKIFPLLTDSSTARISRIKCLRVLSDGCLIASVGTSNYTGVVVIRENRQTLISSEKVIRRLKGKFKNLLLTTLPSNLTPDNKFEVEEIYQTRDNKLWFSTRLKTGPFLLFTAKLVQNKKDSLVTESIIDTKNGPDHGKFSIFQQMADNSLWLVNGDYEKGVSIFNGKYWKNFKLSTIVGDDDLHTDILQTRDNTIWIGGMGNLYAYKNGVWLRYKYPGVPVPSSRINLFEDRKGFLWIMGKQNELHRIDYANNNWQTFKGLNYQCETSDGKKWFLSVDGRVVVNHKNSWYSYGPENGLPDAPVRLFCTTSDVIWATGSDNSNAATARFDGLKWDKMLHPYLSWGIDYRAVFEDKDKNLWFGCSVDVRETKGQLGGVLVLRNPGTSREKWEYFNPRESFKIYNAYGIGQSSDGVIWLGGSRLAKYDGKKWEQTDTVHNINTYYDYVVSNNGGKLWVGSRYYGIYSYDGKVWVNYNVSNGLPSNTIVHILPINDTCLIVATDNNICRFDGTSWIKSIFPEQMNFSREGGDLKISRDGTIWINKSMREWKRRALKNSKLVSEITDNFYSISYKTDNLAPNTYIEEYSTEVSREGNTLISWSGKDFWHNTTPERLSFSYRINGGSWSPFQEKTYETFIGLKSGKYVLDVRARDLDLNTDKTPASIHFRVLPPIWKQPWFVILIIIFIGVIAYFQYQVYKSSREILGLYNSLRASKVLVEEQKEQILEQIQTERESYQQKIRFFTRISHEFRTPLTIIKGITDKIKTVSDEAHHETLGRYVSVLTRNTNHMLKLINQLMDFRKLEDNSMELKVSKGNIVKFIESISCNFLNLAIHYKIDLKFYANFSGADTWFDTDKIEKIVYNLLSNAIKFTPEEGRIKLSVVKYEDINSQTDKFLIIVEDTGIGIHDDEKEKILEPFYQGKNSPVHKYDGTGIGLSMVKSLVELHKGKLYINSNGDHSKHSDDFFSTSFIVEIPGSVNSYLPSEISENNGKDWQVDYSDLALPLEEEDEIVDQNQLIGNLERKNELPVVLLVEDNDDMCQLIMAAFRHNYTFLVARNGAEGYTMAVEALPSLIISDIMMPVLNGIGMCKKIKSDPRVSHIPLIMLTAKVSEENQVEGFAAGADEYITKPFSIQVLTARIKNLIDNRDALRKKFRSELELQPIGKVVSNREEDFIKRVVDIINTNLGNPDFDVEQLSREAGLSSRHLLNKLQSITDYAPVEFIKIMRLKKAEQLLLQTDLSISEIAYDVGFSDPNYFSKCFQKHFGKTPKEFLATKIK